MVSHGPTNNKYELLRLSYANLSARSKIKRLRIPVNSVNAHYDESSPLWAYVYPWLIGTTGICLVVDGLGRARGRSAARQDKRRGSFLLGETPYFSVKESTRRSLQEPCTVWSMLNLVSEQQRAGHEEKGRGAFGIHIEYLSGANSAFCRILRWLLEEGYWTAYSYKLSFLLSKKGITI
ncbi:hypothetical protein GQ44DRAFT_242322 [Phaeosphaeriaceae sp. PMI808]|nr:hypothetical protein GQ44DRAFT_242322 [Phaeosphaeriaceae sp. PMI808]